MALRRLGAAVLVLIGLSVPLATLGWAMSGITPPSIPGLGLNQSIAPVTGPGTGTMLRALSPYLVLVLGFLLAYHRRPSVWAAVLGWAGLLFGLELLAAGVIETAMGADGGWRGLVAAPVTVVLAYGCGRLARVVLTTPIGRDLAGARTETPVRAADGWLLVQADRLVHAAAGRLGGPSGRGPGMPYGELTGAQLGRAGDRPVLRLAGAGRQWLVALRHPHPEQVLALVVARAGNAAPEPEAVGDSKDSKDRDSEDDRDSTDERAAAERDVRAGVTAMRGGTAPKGPGFVLVVAIACLTIAVISFFPTLPNLIFTDASSHTNILGGIFFGVVGLIAAHTYRRYRRGLRYLQNHSGVPVGQHLAPQFAATTAEQPTARKP